MIDSRLLKAGHRQHFNNFAHCEATRSDDYRSGFVFYKKGFFGVYFNGTVVKVTETARPIRQKVEELFESFGCQFVDYFDEEL